MRFAAPNGILRGLSSLAAALICAVGLSRASAQDTTSGTPAQSAPPVNFRERPKYPTDSQRLRRSPQIDGVISDNEWDPFYTITDGPIKGTFYCNWDDNNLYLAVRTEQPATVLFDIDAGGDGWLRGADNLEVVVGSVPDGSTPPIVARLLDAASNKDTPSWNTTSTDPKSFMVAEKSTGGVQVIELAIPKGTGSLVLRPGATIGLRAEFLPPAAPATYLPTQPFEPHLLLDAKLVDSRISSVAGIIPRLSLSDYTCVAGETLFATMQLQNQTDIPVPIRSVIWEGTGNSADAVNTMKDVAVEPIPGLGIRKLTYKTVIPPTLTPGSYTLTVTANMPEGKQVQSTVSFKVVEPLQVQISSDPQPLAIVGPTKLAVLVDIFSQVPNGMRCDVSVDTAPPTWVLDGASKRRTSVDRKGGHTVVKLNFKVPSNTAAGDYPVAVTVRYKGREWPLKQTVTAIRTDAPVQTPPPAH
jgi:hypothetical protein